MRCLFLKEIPSNRLPSFEETKQQSESINVEMSKKEKRLESKKRKAIALLNLMETRVLEEAKMDGPDAKRARVCYSDCDAHDHNCKHQTLTAVASIAQKTEVQQRCSETIDEEYARAKKVQRELQKSANADSGKTQQTPYRYGPKINLCLENMLPFNKFKDCPKGALEDRLPPLFMVDLQHLLLLALLKNFSFWTPRWCRLNRPRKLSSVVLVVLQDVSVKDFEEHPDCFSFLKNSFLGCVEMVSPVQYNSCVEQEICRVPLLISQLKCYSKREDIRQKIIKLISKTSKIPESQDKAAGKTETISAKSQTTEAGQIDRSESKEVPTSVCEEMFPRTSLLLNSEQLMQESYPLPVDCKNKRYQGYAFSQDSYQPVSESSPMYAVDCEMCQTGHKDFELTRVSVVNEDEVVVYDQLVKPYNEITNYLTPYSGMTAEKLSSVTKRLEDVHRDLKELFPPDAILCGQSLWNDLNALKMFHPYVVDTSVIFNQSGDRKIKCGLRKLAFNFLGRKIQGSKQGHCSIEDAKATMDLVKLKLNKGIEFGDAMLGGVYFPDIKTYFQNPAKAQNVEETFSAHAHSTAAASDPCDPPSSSCAPTKASPTPTHSCSQVCSHRVCTQSDCQPAHRTNGCVHSVKSPSEGAEDSTHKDDTHDAACDVRCNQGVMDSKKQGRKEARERWQHCEDDVHQKEVFFQQEGSRVMFSFFELVTDNGNTAGIVGSKELLSRFQSYPKVDHIEVSSDAEACAAAIRVSRHTDLTWVDLTSMADSLSRDSGDCDVTTTTEKRKYLFAQVDSHVQELVTGLETQSLVAVVLTGRREGRQHLNAATFLKMT